MRGKGAAVVWVAALGGCGGCSETDPAAASSVGGGSSSSQASTAVTGGSMATASSSSAGGGGATGGGGTGGEGGAAGSGGMPIDPVCVAYGDTSCARGFECMPFWFEAIYGDAATCAEAAAISCTFDLGAPGSARTEAVVQGCTDAFTAASCDTVTRSVMPECVVLPGQLPDGSACGTDWQCQGRRCAGSFENGCGTCQAAVVAGGSCADDVASCDDGLACLSSQGETCVELGGLGEPCSSGCVGFLVCSAATGNCVQGGAPGDPCVEVGCDPSIGAFCDNGQCVQGVNAEVGEECSPFCKGGICVTMLTSECVARRGEGETCNGTYACQFPLKCVDDLCTLVHPSDC